MKLTQEESVQLHNLKLLTEEDERREERERERETRLGDINFCNLNQHGWSSQGAG